MTAEINQTLLKRYGLPPEEIEALSLRRVGAMLGSSFQGWPEPIKQTIFRMVYACGDPSMAGQVRIHHVAIEAGIEALRGGRPIVVDVRMVEAGLNHKSLDNLGCSVMCAIDSVAVTQEARRLHVTRAASSMISLSPHMDKSIIIIGNAPTALLSVLDLVDMQQVKPALIIGTPVGFVAASESKAELMARHIPFITVEGTRGGSAIAAAAANSLIQLASSSDIDR